MITLRHYQQDAVDSAKNWIKYERKPAILVLPTGAGKSIIIAKISEWCKENNKRVCVVAHRQELLVQNGNKINTNFTFFSAGIGECDAESDIVMAGIQSIYNKDFTAFDVIIADECHRLANNIDMGQYWHFIKKSPNAILLGLTATPYRLQGGKLSWGEIIYNIPHKQLEDEGYLCRITNKIKASLDLTNIKLVAGEYNEAMLAEYMSDPALIDAAVKNIMAYGEDRHSILIFTVTVAHGKLLEEAMQRNGLQSFMVSGGTPQAEREQAVKDFKDRKLKHLINCQIYIEGFDAPNVDMLVCLRPTKSKSLWEQMLGRGVRLFDDKENCLLIDMAGNLEEHGGIGTPFFEKSKKEQDKPKGKICPSCESFVTPTTRQCPDCSFHFPEPEKKQASHEYDADFKSGTVFNPLVTYNVQGVIYRQHIKQKTGSISLRVDYVVPEVKYGVISEWIGTTHEDAKKKEWMQGKLKAFFKKRGYDLPSPVDSYAMDDLISIANRELEKPSKITVDNSKQFPEIRNYSFEPKEVILDDFIPF